MHAREYEHADIRNNISFVLYYVCLFFLVEKINKKKTTKKTQKKTHIWTDIYIYIYIYTFAHSSHPDETAPFEPSH